MIKTRNSKLFAAKICLVGMLCCLTGCSAKSKTVDVTKTVPTDDKHLEMMEETENTLQVYNSFLEKYGLEMSLDGLEKLGEVYAEVNMVSIKLGENDYAQISLDGYSVAVTEDQKFLLMSDDIRQYDLFTGEIIEDYHFAHRMNVAEFICRYGIQPIGYTLPTHVSWSSSSIQSVENEEIQECVKENGFPITVYDSADFYKAFENDPTFSLDVDHTALSVALYNTYLSSFGYTINADGLKRVSDEVFQGRYAILCTENGDSYEVDLENDSLGVTADGKMVFLFGSSRIDLLTGENLENVDIVEITPVASFLDTKEMEAKEYTLLSPSKFGINYDFIQDAYLHRCIYMYGAPIPNYDAATIYKHYSSPSMEEKELIKK